MPRRIPCDNADVSANMRHAGFYCQVGALPRTIGVYFDTGWTDRTGPVPRGILVLTCLALRFFMFPGPPVQTERQRERERKKERNTYFLMPCLPVELAICHFVVGRCRAMFSSS